MFSEISFNLFSFCFEKYIWFIHISICHDLIYQILTLYCHYPSLSNYTLRPLKNIIKEYTNICSRHKETLQTPQSLFFLLRITSRVDWARSNRSQLLKKIKTLNLAWRYLYTTGRWSLLQNLDITLTAFANR